MLALEQTAAFKRGESETEPKFMLIDLRDPHEREIVDLVHEYDGVELPRVNLEYAELVTGFFNADYLMRDHWLICLC